MMNSIPEPDNGVTVQFKYPDGTLKRRRFLSSQPFQVISISLCLILLSLQPSALFKSD